MIFCDVTIPDYQIRNCGIDFAGIIGIALIHDDEDPETSDLEDPQFWVDRRFHEPENYHIIQNTRGEYKDVDVITEEDLDGYLVTGANHTAAIEVPGVRENLEFWETVRLKTWKLCLVTAGELLYYVDKPVTIIPKITNPKSVKEAARMEITLKWYDLSNPYILTAPEGIFYGSNELVPTVEGVFDDYFDETFE
jgi:hypothetical protein